MVTECSMADNVQAELPDVEFVRPCNLCPHMKRITLPKILDSLVYHEGGGRDRSGDRREGAALGRAHDQSEELIARGAVRVLHTAALITDIDTRDRRMIRSLLCPDAFLSPLEIEDAVTRALAEDLGRAGDVTSIATIPEGTPAAPSWWRARPA